MPKLLYFSETMGLGATIELDSGEVCLVSCAQSGVLVKSSRGKLAHLLVHYLGATLYNETVIHLASKTSIALDFLYPENKIPAPINNPVLLSFANAIWHCSTAAEVTRVLNDAIKNSEKK